MERKARLLECEVADDVTFTQEVERDECWWMLLASGELRPEKQLRLLKEPSSSETGPNAHSAWLINPDLHTQPLMAQ